MPTSMEREKEVAELDDAFDVEALVGVLSAVWQGACLGCADALVSSPLTFPGPQREAGRRGRAPALNRS